MVRIDLRARQVNLLVSEEEMARRRAEEAAAPFTGPDHQTPWHEISRQITGQFAGGAVIESAVKYQRIAQTKGLPRDSH